MKVLDYEGKKGENSKLYVLAIINVTYGENVIDARSLYIKRN